MQMGPVGWANEAHWKRPRRSASSPQPRENSFCLHVSHAATTSRGWILAMIVTPGNGYRFLMSKCSLDRAAQSSRQMAPKRSVGEIIATLKESAVYFDHPLVKGPPDSCTVHDDVPKRRHCFGSPTLSLSAKTLE